MTAPSSIQPGTPYRIAVTGHWSLGDVATEAFVAHAFALLLGQFSREHPEGLVALSGLALGADTLFAEAALALDIPLESCIANGAVIEKYARGRERTQHYRLRAQSRVVHELPYAERSAESYLALGHWLVDSCDLLMAVWNGKPPDRPGGTGDVIELALAASRPVLHVHPLKRTITWLHGFQEDLSYPGSRPLTICGKFRTN
ncbi:MAG: hypothetical protein HGA45_16910 [Chloroflexales bacterium]|nr:hypothetical protein [Chloroflexales bacterium]